MKAAGAYRRPAQCRLDSLEQPAGAVRVRREFRRVGAKVEVSRSALQRVREDHLEVHAVDREHRDRPVERPGGDEADLLDVPDDVGKEPVNANVAMAVLGHVQPHVVRCVREMARNPDPVHGERTRRRGDG